MQQRAQAATDFMVSYGIAILIVAISIYIVLRVGIFSGQIAQPTCTTVPNFACGSVAVAHNGLMILTFTQAIGAQINITGAACSTGLSVGNSLPAYGNTGVLANSVNTNYYVNNAMNPGLLIFSDSPAQIQINCYNSGGIVSGPLGSGLSGYVWLNYTFSGLPPSYHIVNRVVQFTTKLS